MKVYEGHNESGELTYFEVPNMFLSRKSAIAIIKSIPEVKVIRENKRDDVFCEFAGKEKHFEIMEPFGDNSRYHVGEKVVQKSEELELIKEIFTSHTRKLK